MLRASFVVLSFVLVLPATVSAGVPELRKQAEDAFRARATTGKIDAAIDAMKKALAIDPMQADNYGLAAMFYSWKAVYDPRTTDAANFFKECVEYAKLGLEVDPNNVPSNYWLGVCYAAYGKERGPMQSLHLLPHVRAAFERVEKKDRCYHFGGVYRMNARIFQKLPSFKGGDIHKAIELYKKALACDGTYPRTHLFLAEAYIDAGMKAEAKATLDAMIARKYPPDLVFEAQSDIREARELLKNLATP